ncbi:hypothetical protein KP79_PYT19307 [Mizuhopecten yessoensis]|uniref:Uncharacterized protein n=2 Tax=Mizuhopecten yessoensis TaxID=6573 RepID=A0A210Q9J0_MIZYE|nr:hypothetical protein KP79_PYT19307 [Mizuhopecten yessoensis]
MKRENLIFIEETDLNLIPRFQGTLRFRLELLEIAYGKWEHVKRESTNLVYESQQNFDVRRLAKCGNEHVINDGVKLLLKRVTVSTNTCCFCTDIIHVGNAESEATATTTMHAVLPVPEDRPERRIIERLRVGLHGQDISRSKELFETFGMPFHEESATREEYWQGELGELLRNRGLVNFLSELEIFLLRRGETELLREIRTYWPRHDYGNALVNYTASGLINDSNLPFIQPPNDIYSQAMPN